MPMPTHLEQQFSARDRQIITPVDILKPVSRSGKIVVLQSGVRALWDTGASGSTISNSLARKLGLRSMGTRQMLSASGTATTNAYLTGLQITQDIMIPQISVMGFAGAGNFDMLIGMDVISRGDFLVSTANGITYFSFMVPSRGGFTLASIQSVSGLKKGS